MARQVSNVARKWRHIQIHGAEYIISTSVRENSWKILLSNLVEIWTETITKDIALSRCQSLNLLLDLDSFDIQETLDAMLSDIPNHITDKSVDEIKLETCIDGIAFRFTISFTKGSPRELWNEITKPLCQASMNLQRRHNILLDLIQRKDEEISEYKLGGAQLTRKNIETQPYNQDVFRNEVSNHSSKSEHCINEFLSMMDLYKDSMNCEASSDYDRRRVSEECGDSIPVEPAITIKSENGGVSKTTVTADGNNHESQSRIEIESTKINPSICVNRPIASRQSEITEQDGVGQTILSNNESKIDLKTKKNVKKRYTLDDMANVPLTSIETPSKRPKSRKNIYDFIA